MPDTQLSLDDAVKLAVQHHQAGRLQEAERYYRAILQAHPQHPDANHNVGVLALQVGKPVLGLPHLKMALEVVPSKGQYWLSYAEGLLAAGQPNEAESLLKQGAKNGLSGETFERLLGHTREAIRAMANPLFPALSFWKVGKSQEAIDWLYEFVRKHPRNPQALAQLGEFLRHQSDRLNESVQMLERAIKHKKDSFIAWLSYGTVLRQLKRNSEAKTAFRKALAINPRLYQAANDLAVILIEENNLDEAIRMFDKACQLLPNNPEQHMSRARALARAKRFEEAESSARQALAEDPNNSSGATMFLAGLGVEPIPDRIPEALLHKLYNMRASIWDAKASSEELIYRGASLVGGALLVAQRTDQLDILDAGCGTGLVGMLVRGQARRLDGVDMSQPMLDKAKEKGVYDSLVKGDLIDFLSQHPDSYDAVLSAATLIHFADLRPIFESCCTALRSNGLFIFTIFPNDDDPAGFAVEHLDGMAQGGCYVHGSDYVAALAERTGFKVEKIERELHERDEGGGPKMCFLVSLSRHG